MDRQLVPGDHLELVGLLTGFEGPGNPTDFDSRQWARRKGLQGRLRVSRGATVRLVERASLGRQGIERLRRAIGNSLDRHLSKASSSLASALILGERHRLDSDFQKALTRAGGAHFLAVSGLHVGLLLGIARWLIGPRSGKAARLGLASVLIGYAALAGSSAATLRATAIALLWLGAEARRRPCSPRNMMGAVLLASLLLNPAWLEDPGLQLSFSAVLAILVGTELLDRRARPVRRWQRALVVSTSAWLGTIPTCAVHFGAIHPASPLVSLLLLPLFLAALSLSFLAVLGLGVPVLMPGVDGALSGVSSIIHAAARVVADLPGTTVSIPPPSVGAWIAIGCWVVVVGRRASPRWMAALVACVVLLWSAGREPATDPPLTLIGLDVGHGSALLIRAGSRDFLVDAGSAHRPRVGSRLILPMLDRYGIDRLDALILTHPDHDHISGVRELVEANRVAHVIVSAYFGVDAVGVRLLDWLRHRRVPVSIVGADDRLDVAGVRLDFHHPPRHAGPSHRAPYSRNDASLTFSLEANGQRVLITGDLEKAGIAALIHRPPPPPHAVLLLPHHGNRVASLADLCRWAGAPLAVASRSDRFDLSSTQRTCRRLGIALYTTDRHGALTVVPAKRPRSEGYRSRARSAALIESAQGR